MPPLQGTRPCFGFSITTARLIRVSPEAAGIGQACRIPGVGRMAQVTGGEISVLGAHGHAQVQGVQPKRAPNASAVLSNGDFKPRFVQKAVDMRLGLDIAAYAADRSVDRVILVTGDTDCLPVMKRARTAGLQVVLVQFPKQRLARELLWHSDFQRLVEWPGPEARSD